MSPITFVPPYTVTVTSTQGGVAHCSYVDGAGQPLPAGAILTTSTQEGDEGSLAINFVETQVEGKYLRLVGATVKTVGNDPTLNSYNYLYGTRTEGNEIWVDGIVVPWGIDQFTLRGVVLIFAQVTKDGAMINFYASTDPQTKNDENLGAAR